MSNLPWFKLYTEARVDRKLAGLTRAEKGVWIDLLCYAAEQEERGCFDASDRYTLAMEVADGDEDLLNSTIEKLLKVRHLVPCPTQGLYETSETTRNEDVTTGNDHVTTGNSLQRYIFRTFAARQAQKVSNFPSDEKDRVNARVRKHRELKKQAKLAHHDEKSVTSETRRNDTDREVDREREEYSLSGKSDIKPVVVERASAPAAAAGSLDQWSEPEARRIAKRIAGRLKLANPNLDSLMAILQQHAYAPAWLEAEAAKCFEYYSTKRRKIDMRLFDNWLKRDEQRQREEEGKILSNGHQQQQHHATADGPGANGSNGHQPSERPKPDWEQRYEYLLAQKRGEAS